MFDFLQWSSSEEYGIAVGVLTDSMMLNAYFEGCRKRGRQTIARTVGASINCELELIA